MKTYRKVGLHVSHKVCIKKFSTFLDSLINFEKTILPDGFTFHPDGQKCRISLYIN